MALHCVTGQAPARQLPIPECAQTEQLLGWRLAFRGRRHGRPRNAVVGRWRSARAALSELGDLVDVALVHQVRPGQDGHSAAGYVAVGSVQPERVDGEVALKPRLLVDGERELMDVAALAGVSKSSVSRGLRGSSLVSAEAKAAVVRAIEELGYRPNAAARTLVRRQSHSIGVLVSDLHNSFFPMVLDGIDAVAEEHGYTSLIVSGKRRGQTEEDALGRLLELQVDGVVAVTERLSRAVLVEAAWSTPLVTLTDTPRIPRVDTVVSDNREGAKLVIDRLVALGHTRIAMIADVTEHAGAERIEGYKAAMNGHRLAHEVSVVNAPLTEQGGYDATRKLLPDTDSVPAIFAGNDLCAFAVLDALAELGVQVPEDMSVP